MESKKSIAVIPARGGSKRIPRKNIKDFCGKPIIAYSIEAAIDSGVFDTVMVSTDDEEIAEISLKYGAEVPFLRSKETSSDFCILKDVLFEVLNKYKSLGIEYEILCCILPTAPFLTGQIIKAGMDLLSDKDTLAVMPLIEFPASPTGSLTINNGFIKVEHPELYLLRSQDLPKEYYDPGLFRYFKVKEFLNIGEWVMPNTAPIILKPMEVQDIDNPEDWKIAEIKYKIIHAE